MTVDAPRVVERFRLAALLEACLVLEEGVAGAREIELGLMAGAGLAPGPFARADADGLDHVLASLERLAEREGERWAAPAILRRLVAQGRLGRSSGQGFFPYPRPDAGSEGPVALERRGSVAIAWLENPPANSLSPAVIAALERTFATVAEDPALRVLLLASANPQIFCAGADIRAFTTMDADRGRAMLDSMHDLLRAMERSDTLTVAVVGGAALGGGCELAMACDLRLAARSASFGQPEIGLGLIPGFGGTQRLPRLVGGARALEINLSGDPLSAIEAFEIGLVNHVHEDHELFDGALGWARRLSALPALAAGEIKRVSAHPDLDAGIAAEKEGFLTTLGSEDAREGIAAFLERRTPRFHGR